MDVIWGLVALKTKRDLKRRSDLVIRREFWPDSIKHLLSFCRNQWESRFFRMGLVYSPGETSRARRRGNEGTRMASGDWQSKVTVKDTEDDIKNRDGWLMLNIDYHTRFLISRWNSITCIFPYSFLQKANLDDWMLLIHLPNNHHTTSTLLW